MTNNLGAARGRFAAENRACSELPQIFLHAGQHYVATSPTLLKMILGSCAGVFLFDPILAIGGATHYMLPHHGSGHASARYGDIAIPDLMGRLLRLGSDRRNLKAKLFGGGSMLSALREMPGSHVGHIGQRNVDVANELLAEASIPIVEHNTLGNRGRSVGMVSNTGEITLEFISQADGHR